jgi:hypothetical protein
MFMEGGRVAPMKAASAAPGLSKDPMTGVMGDMIRGKLRRRMSATGQKQDMFGGMGKAGPVEKPGYKVRGIDPLSQWGTGIPIG